MALREKLQSFLSDTIAGAKLETGRPMVRIVETAAGKIGASGIDQLCDGLSPAAMELLEVIIEAVTVPNTKGSPVNDQQLCEAVASAYMAEHETSFPAGASGAPLRARLGEVLTRLRALKVPWSKIFALISQIVPILTGGGTFAEIMDKIVEMFFPPTPAPGMVAAAKAP